MIRERRREMQIRSMRQAADEAGVSESTWRQVETGRRQANDGSWVTPNPSDETKALICRRLWWTSDSIDRLLRGDYPEMRTDLYDPTAQPKTTADGGEIMDYNDALTAELEYVLSELSISQRAHILVVAKRMLEEEMARVPWIGEDHPPDWHVERRRKLGLTPEVFWMTSEEAMQRWRAESDSQFAIAAEGGLPAKEGPKRNRPSPDPEPEGP